MRDTPGNDGVARNTHTMRVGDHYRAFEKTAFFNPGGPGHFAVSVQAKNSGVNWVVEGLMTSWDDRGYAGAHWSFADLEFPFAADQRGVTHFNRGDVGYGVESSRRAVERNAKSAGAKGGVCWR